MDFELTEEQKMFQSMARKFAEQEILPTLHEYEKAGKLNRDTITKVGKLGLIGPHIPPEYGGLGLDYLTSMIIWEQLAWGSYSQAISACGPTSFGGTMLATFGSEEQKKKYLPPVCSGEKILATPAVEPGAGSDFAALETMAVLDGDEWVINGVKTWITDLGVADTMVIAAQTDKSKGTKGFANFVVDKTESPSGISQSDIHCVGDRSGNVGQVRFVDCRIPKANLIGEVGRGMQNTLHGINVARLAIAALNLGIAQSCLDSSIKYSKERQQFGRPIASFQLVQEEISEMWARIETARWQAYHAASLASKNLQAATKDIAAAKWLTSELAVWAAVKAINVHGSYGCSEDFPIAHHYRDAIQSPVSAGTNGIMKLIIGRELLGIGAFV